MMRNLAPRGAVAAALALSIFGVSMQLGSAGGDIEDQKLEAFITAALAVDRVMDRWQPMIIQADDRQEADSVLDKANAEIRSTIERAHGISLAEYRDIRRIMAADPEILARVTVIMRRQQGR